MLIQNEEILKFENESIYSFKKILSEYRFKLKEIPDIEIKIRLYKSTDSDEIYFETSHFIHTPTQAGVYITSRNSATNEDIALKMAIDTITNFYRSAIREGHKPSINWLKENESY